ncbi:MAG: rhodanese-like domain-containing protein [Deltaproteobacteria bacterium]|nr:rhodanese-like domain-containing protein [Deltaproteobacteria bacterium]
MKRVDKETLKSWLGQPGLFLMDVRSASAWNRSIAKIECSHRFAPEKFGKMLQDIPKNKKLVLYCEDGKTVSPILIQKLEKMGFTNLNLLEGGFQTWKGKEFPAVPKEVE